MMNTLDESTIPDYIDWNQISWKRPDEYVVKLQQRIYQAEIDGDKRKVRELQRILLNSKANLLIILKSSNLWKLLKYMRVSLVGAHFRQFRQLVKVKLQIT